MKAVDFGVKSSCIDWIGIEPCPVASAGCDPAGYVHPLAGEVMREAGIKIGGRESKSHREFFEKEIHTVVTVCGNANDCCPVFLGQVNRYHWSFDDPAHFEGEFGRVRDEIKRVMEVYVIGVREEIGVGGER